MDLRKAKVAYTSKHRMWVAMVPGDRPRFFQSWRTAQDWAYDEMVSRGQLAKVVKHLSEWDKRHHPSGRRRFWARVNSAVWLPALGVLLMALIASALIVFLWPHQPDSVLPSNIYTPFTKVPQPSRPPHPLSVYVPPGYEGK